MSTMKKFYMIKSMNLVCFTIAALLLASCSSTDSLKLESGIYSYNKISLKNVVALEIPSTFKKGKSELHLVKDHLQWRLSFMAHNNRGKRINFSKSPLSPEINLHLLISKNAPKNGKFFCMGDRNFFKRNKDVLVCLEDENTRLSRKTKYC